MSATSGPAIRILEVVGAMNHGGVEAWLVNALRHIDRERFNVDFLVHAGDAYDYNDTVRQLGSKVIVCPGPSRPWAYGRELRALLRAHGPYHIVHSHLHFFNGLVMYIAEREGVPVRVAHSHLNSSFKESHSPLARRIYLLVMRKWIAKHATHGIGCSKQAMADLFGTTWESDPRMTLMYCGIDIESAQLATDSQAIRQELGIPVGSLVAGHVGRFTEQKNHRFLLEIVAEMIKIEPTTYLVLVGDGPLRAEVRHRAEKLGIAKQVIFTGTRSDVAQLMRGAFDVFLFPSLYEGLGLVLIEAQAANLPCVMSASLPEEANVIDGLVKRIGLNESAQKWARTATELAKQQDRLSGASQALSAIRGSKFNIAYSAQELANFYRNAALHLHP